MNTSLVLFTFAIVVIIYMVFRSLNGTRAIARYLKAGALVIDVRSKQEYNGGHVGSAVNIPIDQFEARLTEIGTSKERPIIVYCHAGSRAAIAEGILRKNGFTQVINARRREALQKFES